ncbi:MAG: DUF3857 domain-containing transglutaminase family protein [Lentimicrobium sp.]|jgi:transglutaminase-like putative cysteine protease|nr:DUF3857 domain-containing transglutaminase family protein [Lentimicrobium sp.]
MKNVMIVSILLLWVSLFFGPLCAQDFAVSGIPEALTKGANSVMRESKITYSIKGGNQVYIHEYAATTIMNSKALSLAHLKIFYNTSDKLKIITATIYDAQGKKMRTIKRSEMKDYSMAGDATMYSDQRVVFCQVVPVSYPFTVVYEYELTFDHLYGIIKYSPYNDSYQSVEKSSLTIETPIGIPLNIKTLNLPQNFELQKTDASTLYQFSDLPPLVEEPFSPDFSEIRPVVRIATELIVYKKYSGKANSWENFGNFLAQLTMEDKGLSLETTELLRQKTASAKTTREKVKIIYKYLQSRTHYINISLGIGGIQPHPVAEVDAFGYGDCKDLSTYMIAMLKAVNVDACYAVIKSGKGSYYFMPDYPNHQFDHAIVCVPNHNDTLWLECTSQVQPFGYLGGFTDNRYALIVKDKGSKLVKTPEYTKKDNFIHSTFALEYSDGNTSAIGNITWGGLPMDKVISVPGQTRTEQLSWIDHMLEIPDFSLVNHRFQSLEDPEPSIVLTLDLALKSYYNGNGDRLFVPLNLCNKIGLPPRMRSRSYPVDLPFAYHTADTLKILIPSGYQPEQLPQGLAEDEIFGAYAMQTTLTGDTITCIRTFELNKGRHAPEMYQRFYEFMQKANLADSRQLVLIKQE